MKTESHRQADPLASEDYHPKALIDHVKQVLGVKRDYELVKFVGFNASVISKVRNKRKLLSDELLLALHDATGIPIKEMKQMMGRPENAKPIRVIEKFQGDCSP